MHTNILHGFFAPTAVSRVKKVLKTQVGSIDRPYKEVKEMTILRKENGREKVVAEPEIQSFC